jgi:DNA-binding response OmpR family regulator
VILVTGDLMFWAQVKAAAERAGVDVARVDDETGLEAALSREGVAKVLVDLEVAGVDPLLSARRFKEGPEPPVLVAFGSHVDEARLRAAAEAGFDVVMPRSRFARSVADLLQSD